LGSIGGRTTQTFTLVTANLPPYTPTGSITNGAISISQNAAVNGGGSGTPGPFTAALNAPGAATITASQGASTFAGSAQGGTSAAISTAPPLMLITVYMKL
jgi:hypothetical protein